MNFTRNLNYINVFKKLVSMAVLYVLCKRYTCGKIKQQTNTNSATRNPTKIWVDLIIFFPIFCFIKKTK